ncbi:hypothetical protein [Croceicoccus ponticola]|nr:hypothetical protein [Croceicoccus ponticola]
MDNIVVVILALVAVFVAWKVLKGIVKTIVLVGILIAAAVFVFGVL